MGWIHDDENDSDGFHRGLEGGGSLSVDRRTPEQKTADDAREAARMANVAEAVAALPEGLDALHGAVAPDRKVMVLFYDEYEDKMKPYPKPADMAIWMALDVAGGVAGRWTDEGLVFVDQGGRTWKYEFAPPDPPKRGPLAKFVKAR